MLRVCLLLLGLGMLGGASAQDTSRILRTDVLVIGGGTGGTAAAIQCARRQVQTVLVEPTRMLGGMLSAAGVSCTDGNDELPSGMWEEFRQALYRHYGTRELNTGWVSNTCFEPHVADSIFKAWAAREKSLTVLYGYRFEQVLMEGSRVQGALFRAGNGSSLRIEARLVIDATELGDVLAGAGADYDLGMEDPAQTGESQAPGTYPIIQDITWTAIVRLDGRGPAKGIRRPADYDERRYYCCNTDAPCQGKPWNGNTAKMLAYGKLPNNKYMINWPFHGNDYYLNVVEGHEAERRAGYEKARDQTRGFLYFLQTRLGLKKLRLATDELDGGLALIPYNREGRRVRGVVRFNLNHILRPFDYTLFRTGVAVGDYPVDHHHGQYPGKVPAIDFPPVPSYNLPMGCLIPAKTEGLLVCEKGISVTNLVNGTTRLQPVVLLTGQAVGVLAALSIKGEGDPRDVPVRFLQQELLDDSCYLLPYCDVDRSDPAWKAVQRVGLTGILRGLGRPRDWSNQTLFQPDSILAADSFRTTVLQYDPAVRLDLVPAGQPVTWPYLSRLIAQVSPDAGSDQARYTQAKGLLKARDLEPGRPLTKKEIAVLLDRFCLAWILRDVDMNGRPLEEEEP